MYIHELKGWPEFIWDQEKIASLLIAVHHLQGLLTGRMESIGFRSREEMFLQTLTQDVVKSSEIEGEILDQSLVRSSVARHLKIDVAGIDHQDRQVEGMVEMMIDATQNFNRPLTQQRLFNWHQALFPTGWSGHTKIMVGKWRKKDVQVVSGRLDKEIIHFEGPPPNRVSKEMRHFLHWINHERKMDLALKAAIAHLWFVTIHPFDDGNGRIGRAIADLLLARCEMSAHRFYSLSAQIQKERKGYYYILERTQKGGLEITPWIEWFFHCLEKAMGQVLLVLDKTKNKERAWKMFANAPCNARQRKLLNLLLDGFEGNLTSSKWAKIAKCSQDTAYRDILELVDRGILVKNRGGGRNTSYSLVKY